ncbi:SHOCT domain-containing protein [Noviherbaspirillum sedimenti]|uniref:SHOCT domain-containing protein n=1 Tax=Noviherbaspirillum sedimenti TaxID=2320865 RepID=A0A3A3G7W2_9BURK|nr:SHOCT domain-containing protein [Noviherbaspirillum sedimenti]RJG02642.1 SHOCT domain-containing protein [Noviherbaspirillum sedimenti]
MYETGGGIRIGMAIFCAICIAPFAYVILSLGGHGTVFSGLFKLALALLQLYFLYRLICWISSKLKRSDPAPQYTEANPEQSPQSPGNPVSRIEAIEKLVAFKERGLLTQEEFEKEKRKILEN